MQPHEILVYHSLYPSSFHLGSSLGEDQSLVEGVLGCWHVSAKPELSPEIGPGPWLLR
jgi:hypothetical protein